ncbi:MAG: hypothetical protein CVU42_00230 [Chloroflexi bacterium HGW-Chloroflexi-4]|nr:MAG: hypothetical protein CVU42_00230 [Chloroflexi bacterium HGW-Chloroflexi-4]
MQISGPMPDQNFPEYFSLARLNINRCLAPGECPDMAIAAHSVQKSRFIKQLAEDGHVLTVKLDATARNGLSIDLHSVGINQATTFTGLCANHDNAIFSPIEKQEIDFNNSEQLFLLAYRCAVSELHEQMVSAIRVQGGYTNRVRKGIDSGTVPSQACLQATQRLVLAYEAYQYKCTLDAALNERRFKFLRHEVIRVPTQMATVAGNSVYSVDDVNVGDSWLRVHLNVLPISQSETVVVFSYVKDASKKALHHLAPVLSSQDGSDRLKLSQFIIDGCGNTVFRPSFVHSWSHTKHDAVLKYFLDSAWKPQLDRIAEDLGVFALET